MPTNGFSTKPPKVKLLAGEQKATKVDRDNMFSSCPPKDKLPDDFVEEALASLGWDDRELLFGWMFELKISYFITR